MVIIPRVPTKNRENSLIFMGLQNTCIVFQVILILVLYMPYLLKKIIGFLLLVATVGLVSIQALIHTFQ